MRPHKITPHLTLLISALNPERQPALADWLNEQGGHPALPLLDEAVSKFSAMEREQARKSAMNDSARIAGNAHEETVRELAKLRQMVELLANTPKPDLCATVKAAEVKLVANVEAAEFRLRRLAFVGIAMITAILVVVVSHEFFGKADASMKDSIEKGYRS